MSSPRSGECWGPRAAREAGQSQGLILPRAVPLFTRNKGGLGSSAVCAFPMHSVQRAFSGLYKEVNRETQQWYTDTSPVPEPRPGTVGGPLAPARAQDTALPHCSPSPSGFHSTAPL